MTVPVPGWHQAARMTFEAQSWWSLTPPSMFLGWFQVWQGVSILNIKIGSILNIEMNTADVGETRAAWLVSPAR